MLNRKEALWKAMEDPNVIPPHDWEPEDERSGETDDGFGEFDDDVELDKGVGVDGVEPEGDHGTSEVHGKETEKGYQRPRRDEALEPIEPAQKGVLTHTTPALTSVGYSSEPVRKFAVWKDKGVISVGFPGQIISSLTLELDGKGGEGMPMWTLDLSLLRCGCWDYELRRDVLATG